MVAPMFPWHVALEGGGHPYLYLYMIIRVLPCVATLHTLPRKYLSLENSHSHVNLFRTI
jgi:hypothetical protein